MTIQRSAGPLIIVGAQAPIGTPTGAFGGPYISGVEGNPDAAPSAIAHGVALRDTRIRSRPDGVQLSVGGYANQDFCFVAGEFLTLNFAPAAKAANNIVSAAAPASGVPMTLANASTGIAVLASAYTVPGFLNVIPAGCLLIDAVPSYTSYSASGAVQGWAGAAAGRAITLTSSATLAGINFTVKGYDLYGFPQSEVIAGPGSATTVNSRKCYKWLQSITPNGTSANTAAFSTLDIFEFPIMARFPFQTEITWNNAPVTVAAVDTAGAVLSVTADHFMPADTTNPATTTTGTVRGAYTAHDAADGTKRLQVMQTILPGDLVNPLLTWGVVPV